MMANLEDGVLGKRALAMVMKHEFAGGDDTCPECGGGNPERRNPYTRPGHDHDCEWGRIVKAAKEIG